MTKIKFKLLQTEIYELAWDRRGRIEFAVVNARGISCRSGISVQRYDLRASAPRTGSFYRRNRRDGDNPVVLAHTLSGHGVPRWMRNLAEYGNRCARLARDGAQ